MMKVLVWNCADESLKEYADEEIKHLKNLASDDFDVTIVGRSVGWRGLADVAREVQPTIFHFIGHGDKKGNLEVREEADFLLGRPAEEVIKLVRKASPGLEGVFLSACYSAKTGPELLRPLPTAGGWAIGTSSGIQGDQASDFSTTFYRLLVSDPESPKTAFDIAANYSAGDYPELLHKVWFSRSVVPPLEEMARNIYTAIYELFDRASFQEPLEDEFSMTELDLALQDIGHALGTGQVLSRKDRTVIVPLSFPADWLRSDPKIVAFVRSAKRGLTKARTALAEVMDGAPKDRIMGNISDFRGPTTTDQWMVRVNDVDWARNQILKAANKFFDNGDLPPFDDIPLSFNPAEIAGARQ
jgi:hypothetical protein